MVGKRVRSFTCAKCGLVSTDLDSSVTFHRFPLPSVHGSLKAKVWAKFCFPNEEWSSDTSLYELYKGYKMLCSNHFDDSSYTSSDRKRLNNFAIPMEAKNILAQLRDETLNPPLQLNLDTSHSEVKIDSEVTASQTVTSLPSTSSGIMDNLQSPPLFKVKEYLCKMMTVCLILCLRNDRNISSQNVSIELENFYEELCEYGTGRTVHKFCYECIYKLKKCYKFKKSCQLAVETLTTWRKQAKDVRKPITLLYKEIPAQLGLCNKNNFKVYFYQTADLKMPTSIHMSSSNHPHIVTVNIPTDENIEKLYFDIENGNEQATDTLIINENDIKTEMIELEDDANQILEKVETFVLKIEPDPETEPHAKNLQDEELGSADDISDFENEILKNDSNDNESDSDESLKNLENLLEALRRPKKTLLEMADININDAGAESKPEKVSDSDEIMKLKRKRNKRTIDLKRLKVKLKEKFEQYGPIKGPRGNIIEKDVILNNFDKIEWGHLPINKICSGHGPLKENVIMKLSQLQDDITIYGSVFEKLMLEDPEQIKEHFEKRREFSRYKKSGYHCDICITNFVNPYLRDHHIKTAHNPDFPLECSVCHVRFQCKKRLALHHRVHMTLFKCKLCVFATGYRSVMIEHYNNHKGIKYNCNYCNSTFKSRSTLCQHINLCHEPKHICELCASAFKTPPGLARHKMLKHTGEQFVESEDNKKCEKCNIIFLSSEVYNKHMKLTHAENCRSNKGRPRGSTLPSVEKGGDYLCQICGKQLKYRYEIQEHVLKHSGTRPFLCTQCPKTFISKIQLRVHMQRHLPPTHECKFCDKKFTTYGGWYSHNRIHINDRRFVCKICGKGFLYNGSLKEHVDGVHYNIRKRKRPRQNEIDSE